MIASWDMFLITTIGRSIFGLIVALMLGFLGFLFATVSLPPLSWGERRLATGDPDPRDEPGGAARLDRPFALLRL